MKVDPMTTAALKKLHDIHLPTPISWWPPAPGWFLLAFILAFIAFILIRKARRAYLAEQPKRQALMLLKSYRAEFQEEKNAQESCARVSELLRRVALVYFPRETVAVLTGEQWIAFLNSSVKGVSFDPVKDQLLMAPYRPTDDKVLTALFNRAEAWIKQRSKPCSN